MAESGECILDWYHSTLIRGSRDVLPARRKHDLERTADEVETSFDTLLKIDGKASATVANRAIVVRRYRGLGCRFD